MTGKEPDRQVFKKLRLSGSFRETVVSTPVKDIRIAVVDGLKGLDKLNSVISDGSRFDLVEVMTCPGGCIHGAGLPFITSKDDIRNRARLIYQAVESEAISLPCKSPSMLNLNEKLISSDPETAGRDMFRTHYEKRNVLL